MGINRRSVIGLVWLALILWLPGLGLAALPVAVNGQQLPSLAPMLKQTTPAVVNISTRGRTQVHSPLLNDPLFQYFFNVPGLEQEQETTSLGSGVIVDAEQGFILTNNHVIEDAIEINVTLLDGREYKAQILGRDPDTDIAVIKVDAQDLISISLGDSSKLQVGDFVVAIGNPFGLGQTVTSGIVSALGRSGLGLESYEDFIQTDASINLGNSGGALVNLRGELVGVNTAILGGGDSQGNIGIGFAIPINMASDIMQQLIEFGEVKRGRLGVQAQDLTPQLASAFNIDLAYGAIVTQVERGSPAEMAGLKVGDVIIRANGRVIRSSRDIHNLVGMMRVGQKVQLEIVRQGRSGVISATIRQKEVVSLDGSEFSYRLAGARIGEIIETDIRQGEIAYLQIIEVQLNSPAWGAGLRKGDVIHSINKRRVTSLEEAYAAAHSNRSLLLNIERGDQAMYLLLK
jgi:serine protease Do/serine protease DegQ